MITLDEKKKSFFIIFLIIFIFLCCINNCRTLKAQNLTGTLPSELTGLPHLEEMYVTINSF